MDVLSAQSSAYGMTNIPLWYVIRFQNIETKDVSENGMPEYTQHNILSSTKF